MPKKILKPIKTWWIYLVLGIIVLLCGGNFLAYPLATLTTVSFATGLYFLITGIGNGATAVVERDNKSWTAYLVLNIVIAILGIVMMTKMRFTVSYIWLITGFGFIFQAVLMILKAIEFKKDNDKGWILMMIFAGIIAFCGLLVLGNPIWGLSIIAFFVAAAVICYGVYLIVLSFQLKPPKTNKK